MVRNREEAASAAENTHRNTPGMCQHQTWVWFAGSSAGDRDHDGDADAVDGWLSEPAQAKHAGDRHPPRGVPVSWSGGSHGHGHRAISLGDGKIRTTDGDGEGVVATRDLDWPEQAWGLHYLGWSETIDGQTIPVPPPPPPPAPTRLTNFHASKPYYDLKILDKAIENGRDDILKIRRRIDVAVRKLPKERASTRVGQFLRAYDSGRILRMGLLHRAVHQGNRHGTVEHVYDELHALINDLPKR
jgi:hypothetical protein